MAAVRMWSPRRRRAGQVGVMDAGLAAFLGMAALFGLYGVSTMLRSSSQGDSDYDVLVAVVHEVQAAARHYSSYDGIDTAYVVTRGHLPAKAVNAGRILLGQDGLVTVTPAASPAATFSLSAAGLSQARCVHLSVTPIDDRQAALSVNGQALGTSPSVPAAEAACRRAAASTLVWTLG